MSSETLRLVDELCLLCTASPRTIASAPVVSAETALKVSAAAASVEPKSDGSSTVAIPIADVSKASSTRSERMSRLKEPRKVLVYYSPEQWPKHQRVDLKRIADDYGDAIDVIQVCTFHLCQFEDGSLVHLNDYSPDNAMFKEIIEGVAYCQSLGIAVTAMLGGCEGKKRFSPRSESTWVNLFTHFDIFYPALRQLLQLWAFDGIDLDLENPLPWDQSHKCGNLQCIAKLMRCLKRDFGHEFGIIFAPVAACIFDKAIPGISGVSYFELCRMQSSDSSAKTETVGLSTAAASVESETSSCVPKVSLLNLQFYNGWGNLESATQMQAAVRNMRECKVEPSAMLCGMISVQTAAKAEVCQSILELARTFPHSFGGVFVWVGNDARIGKWARLMKSLMKTGRAVAQASDWA